VLGLLTEVVRGRDEGAMAAAAARRKKEDLRLILTK